MSLCAEYLRERNKINRFQTLEKKKLETVTYVLNNFIYLNLSEQHIRLLISITYALITTKSSKPRSDFRPKTSKKIRRINVRMVGTRWDEMNESNEWIEFWNDQSSFLYFNLTKYESIVESVSCNIETSNYQVLIYFYFYFQFLFDLPMVKCLQ